MGIGKIVRVRDRARAGLPEGGEGVQRRVRQVEGLASGGLEGGGRDQRTTEREGYEPQGPTEREREAARAWKPENGPEGATERQARSEEGDGDV